MAEKIFRASRAALTALPAWDADTQAAAGTISGLVDAYETVGTGSDYGAAWLARMLLYAGAPAAVTTVEESEDWLHVNFLQLTPERFATLVFVAEENEAADRTQRTLSYIEGVGRRTVIFTDLPRRMLRTQAPIIEMPSHGSIAASGLPAAPGRAADWPLGLSIDERWNHSREKIHCYGA